MRLIPDFDEIMELIDQHGEPIECEIECCLICLEINEARYIYTGDKRSLNPKKYAHNGEMNINSKNKYIVTDKNGVETIFYSKLKVNKFIKTCAKYVDPIVNTGERYKGYKVDMVELKQKNLASATNTN